MIEFTCDDKEIETQQYLDIVEICNECVVEEDEYLFLNVFSEYLSYESIELQDNLTGYLHNIIFSNAISLTYYAFNDERVNILNKEQSSRVRKILG